MYKQIKNIVGLKNFASVFTNAFVMVFIKLQSHWGADWHAARGLSEIAKIGNPRQTVSNRVF